MQVHQKSFGVEDASGNLMPHFLTVLNLHPKDLSLVKKGWERVLRARLEDGRFFWKTDLEATFDEWLEALDAVTFLAPLGSMGEKTRASIRALCRWLAEKVQQDPEQAARAGRLSKADLVSAMVGEFDTLQGIMGGISCPQKGRKRKLSPRPLPNSICRPALIRPFLARGLVPSCPLRIRWIPLSGVSVWA